MIDCILRQSIERHAIMVQRLVDCMSGTNDNEAEIITPQRKL